MNRLPGSDIVGGSADANLHLVRLQDPMLSVRVPVLKGRGIQGEGDRPCFSGRKVNPLESLQLLQRSLHLRIQVRGIKLHHLVPGPLAGIADVNPYA